MDIRKIAKRLVRSSRNFTADENDNPYYFVMQCVEKQAEEDVYEEGVNGKTSNFSMNITVSDRNLKKCAEKACNSIGIDFDIDNFFIQDGFITMSKMENDDGEEASDPEIESWKKGETRLWLCDYIWSVTMRLDKELDENFIESELRK